MRGVVSCWGVADDDLRDSDEQDALKAKMREVVCMLGALVGDGFGAAQEKLLAEDESLRELFG